MKAEDIASYDVTPSWERPPPEPAHAPWDGLCHCGFCQLAAAGHL